MAPHHPLSYMYVNGDCIALYSHDTAIHKITVLLLTKLIESVFCSINYVLLL